MEDGFLGKTNAEPIGYASSIDYAETTHRAAPNQLHLDLAWHSLLLNQIITEHSERNLELQAAWVHECGGDGKRCQSRAITPRLGTNQIFEASRPSRVPHISRKRRSKALLPAAFSGAGKNSGGIWFVTITFHTWSSMLDRRRRPDDIPHTTVAYGWCCYPYCGTSAPYEQPRVFHLTPNKTLILPNPTYIIPAVMCEVPDQSQSDCCTRDTC